MKIFILLFIYISLYASDLEIATAMFEKHRDQFNSGDDKQIEAAGDQNSPKIEIINELFSGNSTLIQYGMNISHSEIEVARIMGTDSKRFKDSVLIHSIIPIDNYQDLMEKCKKYGSKKWYSEEAYKLLKPEAKVFIASCRIFGRDNVLGPIAVINGKGMFINQLNDAISSLWEYQVEQYTYEDEETNEVIKAERVIPKEYPKPKFEEAKVINLKIGDLIEEPIEFSKIGERNLFFVMKNWKGRLGFFVPRDKNVVLRAFDSRGNNIKEAIDGFFENKFNEELPMGGYYFLVVSPLDKSDEFKAVISGWPPREEKVDLSK